MTLSLAIAGDPDTLQPDGPLPLKAVADRFVRDDSEQAYLATCLCVKDQNQDLREWIAYHQSIGVGKFYVFDDGSSMPVAEGLQDLIKEGKEATVAHVNWLCQSDRQARYILPVIM